MSVKAHMSTQLDCYYYVRDSANRRQPDVPADFINNRSYLSLFLLLSLCCKISAGWQMFSYNLRAVFNLSSYSLQRLHLPVYI